MQTPPFKDLAHKLRPEGLYSETLICFDPGETTGLAVLHGLDLVESGQLDTKDLRQGSEEVNAVFDRYFYLPTIPPKPTNQNIHVVIEDYRVYGWKTDQHTWASLHTPKFIGCIIALCVVHDLQFTMQMAHQAKQFCTDDKLKAWKFYQRGLKHARDAIRHGCYYTLFNKDEAH